MQLSDGQQNDSGFLAAGTYSVSETVPSGWTQTSSSCDDGSSPGSISLQAGETVKCTFNNAQNGQVIVKKVMVGGTDSFSYTGTPSGAIAVNNGTISQAVAPGQYTSTEAAKAGWDLTALSCDDANSTGSLANRQATFNVEAGETVTCTFTNTQAGPGHRQEGDGRRHRLVQLHGNAVGRDRREQRHDLAGGRSGPVHVHGGREGRLGPDRALLRRRELDRLARQSAGDLQRRSGRDRDLHLHEHASRARSSSRR